MTDREFWQRTYIAALEAVLYNMDWEEFKEAEAVADMFDCASMMANKAYKDMKTNAPL